MTYSSSFRWQHLPVQRLSVPILVGGDGRNPAESAVSRGSVASSWRLLHPLHTPPPWLWVVASSAIGGLGDKASCFFLYASSPRGQSLSLLKPFPHQDTVFYPSWGLRSVSTDTERAQKAQR
ncbi:hypothetical protein AMECASPLE_007465 [Ameca splendens]|uniref:Uncharacterized protein n=1 Tax=Ameca splendens TaxID=208324 RepID=A0ABV0ZJE2_9TELE